ncbi:MAG: radical SAM family heme chaperone HemW [Gammaproteobacteria bacterium]|nr:radical SAM family heme chaperone HemW [Gammaproteobacteria bacterium]
MSAAPTVPAGGSEGLAVYVHLPWCVSKCPYCDFNSHTLRGSLPEAQYVAALLADLDADLPSLSGRRVASLFVGGGTPSLFSGRSIESLLIGVASRLEIAADVEITLEVNPGTVERGRLADYRAAGVNRLSIGAQSFDAGKLRVLGRIHGPEEISAAVAEARAGGFSNINLDLMYGLPEQSPSQALADVRAALALEPTHLSHYQLTLEPNTRFHHQPPPLPDEDTLWEIESACRPVLVGAGFERYEVSAWAQPGAECRHNLAYWRFADYLGLGAGAHGKLSSAEGVRRRWRIAHPQGYLLAAAPRLAGERWLVAEDLVCEYLMNVLRLREGFTLAAFTARTGLAALQLAPSLERLRDRGLMTLEAGRWRASDQGYAHLDGLLAEFLPAAPSPS